MARAEQIERGLANWLDAELMPKLPQEGWQKVIVGTAMSIIIKRGGNLVRNLMRNPVVVALEIVDEADEIDLDLIRAELKNNIPDTGMKVHLPMIGDITFRKNDVDTLYAHIKEAG